MEEKKNKTEEVSKVETTVAEEQSSAVSDVSNSETTAKKSDTSQMEANISIDETNPQIEIAESDDESPIKAGEPEVPKIIKNKKYSWILNIFLLVMIVVGIVLMVLVTVDMMDEIDSFESVIKNINIEYAIYALLAFLLIIIFDIFRYHIVAMSVVKKPKLLVSTKTAFIGRYYDNITPFSTGGQPMQIYYLHKKGCSGGQSSSIIVIKYFASMFAWLIVSFCFMVFNRQALGTVPESTAKLFGWAAWVGWGFTALLPTFIILFVLAPKLTNKIVVGIITLGYKMKIVKDKEGVLNKAYKIVDDFRTSFKFMAKKPLKFIMLMLVCVLEQLAIYALPFFIMTALASNTVAFNFETLFLVMTLNYYAAFSVVIIPTPGNSGFVEMAVLVAFSGVLPDATVFWVVFLWRFFAYYIFIIIGLIISVVDVARNFSKRNKRKRLN